MLSTDFLDSLTEDYPYKHLLIEGVAEGHGELILALSRGEQPLGECPALHIDIKNVRKMLDRVKVTSLPDPIAPPSEAAFPADDPPEPEMSWGRFPDPTVYYSPASWTETKQYVIYVHGWNEDEATSEGRAATIFKRFWQLGYRGRFAYMRWPTYVGGFTFNDSEYRAWKSGESLKQYVESLPNDYDKNLVAHSLGNVVCGSALQKGLAVENYAMLNAAVSASCYDDDQGLRTNSFTTPHYDSDPGTQNLSYRYKLNSVGARLINFYLSTDDALDSWNQNNDSFKPQRYNLGLTGYFYDPSAPVGERLAIDYLFSIGRFVRTPHEAMAYVAKSPTFAVGAEDRTAGSVGTNIDLATFGFQNGHAGTDNHVSVFNYPLQKAIPFYQQVLSELGINPTP